jgi:hypothetical protein
MQGSWQPPRCILQQHNPQLLSLRFSNLLKLLITKPTYQEGIELGDDYTHVFDCGSKKKKL